MHDVWVIANFVEQLLIFLNIEKNYCAWICLEMCLFVNINYELL